MHLPGRWLGLLLAEMISAQLSGQDQVGGGVWRNYDFTPGKTVGLATDFRGGLLDVASDAGRSGPK